MNDKAKHPILDLPMDAANNDAGAISIRDYMLSLLRKLFKEGEGFSGKRPFGNSDWEYELYAALIKGGVVKGTIDKHGCVDTCNTRAADQVLQKAIGDL